MNTRFDKRNTVKIISKGPFGRARRLRAARFYENTLLHFGVADYGTSFAWQKRLDRNRVFANYTGDRAAINTMLGLTNASEEGINFGAALALRTNGWTMDRLLMRSRDMHYATNYRAARHYPMNDREAAANSEPKLTLGDFTAFLMADRLSGEPGLVAELKTKQQLEDMGYKLAARAMPVYSRGDTAFYDLSNVEQTYRSREDYALGKPLNNVRLDCVKDGNFDTIASTLAQKLNITLTKDAGQTVSVKYNGQKGIFSRVYHRIRRGISRLNTGIRDPIMDQSQLLYKDNVTTADVANVIKKITDIATIESMSSYVWMAGSNYPYKKHQLALQEINSNLLASAVCRMGMFSEHDAKVLSTYFKTNAARKIQEINTDFTVEESQEMMDCVILMYSVNARRMANALDIDLQLFAKCSNLMFNPQYDSTFDDVLCKTDNLSTMRHVFDDVQEPEDDAENVDAHERVRRVVETAVEEHNNQQNDADTNAIADQNNTEEPAAATEETAGTSEDHSVEDTNEAPAEESTEATEEESTQDDAVVETEDDSTTQDDDTTTATEETVETEDASQADGEGNANATDQTAEDVAEAAIAHARRRVYERLDTTYEVQSDFGFVSVDLDEGEREFRRSIPSKRLMQAVCDEFVKPGLSEIMAEYDDLADDTQNDICAVIRKYNKMMAISTMTTGERKAAKRDFIQKIDAVRGDNSGRIESVTKAFNLYTLTRTIAQDIITYRDATPALADEKSLKNVFNYYVVQQGGMQETRGEVKELIKDEVLLLGNLATNRR